MQAEQQSEREALYTLIRGFGFTTFAQTWKIVDAIMARAALSHPSTPQGWQPMREAKTIDVAYMEGDPPFIFAVHGRITVEALVSIEKDLAENPPDKGDGDYRYEATYFKGQYGEFGVCELAPGWELSEISFTPFPPHPEQGDPQCLTAIP